MQFQGGSVFPIALLLVVVLGVASIVYARQTIPGAGDGAPVTPISEYYDVAYGINICGDWATINDGGGAVNADGRIDYPAYRDTGVYQYADGVATVHPYAAELADVPLDLSALLGCERAVMQGDRQVLLVGVPERLEDQLRLGAGVDEDERGPVRPDRCVDPVDGVEPHMPGPGEALIVLFPAGPRSTGQQDLHLGLRRLAHHTQRSKDGRTTETVVNG